MLPFMRTKPKKVERNTVAFGGLNVTSGAREGELKNCKNVSAEFFPNLATRRGRTRTNTYNKPSALHTFNGFIVVNGTDIIYNGQIVGTVTEGRKQFAVVANKLVIHPDMLLLDLENSKLSGLGASVSADANSSTFANDGTNASLEITSSIAAGTGEKLFTYTETTEPIVKIYTALLWDAEDGWTKTGEAEVSVSDLAVGNLLIPAKVLESGAFVIPIKAGTEYTGEDNTEGVYYEITSASNISANQVKWDKYNTSYHAGDCNYRRGSFVFDTSGPMSPGDSWVLKQGYNFRSYENTFYATNWSNITIGYGLPGTGYDVETNIVIKYVSDGTNLSRSILYASHSTYGCDADYYVKGSALLESVYAVDGTYPDNGASGGYWYVKVGVTGFNGSTTIGYDRINSLDTESFLDHFKAGDIVNLSGCTTITSNNKNDLIIKSVEAAKIIFEEGSALTAGTEAGEVKIERPVPDLDFICGNDNRLWGVNSDGIYASAWADPTNFRKLSALSTDSYFVEIGSAGDFTGIFSYSGDVLCFKDDKLYRVFGEYPAEYSVQSYDISGVQAGSQKSMAIINETLFYKGKEGIYAYSGGVPQLISYNLGLNNFFNATAGVDGSHYYVSMQDEAGEWALYVYDTFTKLWVKEDNVKAIDFAYQNGYLYMIDGESGNMYKLNDPTSEELIEWEAEFTTFYGETLSRKTHNRVFMRVEMAAGSFLEIHVQFDDGVFNKVFSTWFEGRKTMNIPIPIMRCDSFTIRLVGSGECKVMGMEREFLLGSEY